MTAQFRRLYSTASFKTFFPESCTTRNFRNTKRPILQELQTGIKNKAIRNLSSLQINLSSLALGLNFVPTPPTYTHHLVLKSANRLTQTRKKQYHVRMQPLTNKRPTYCKPSIWIPPEPNSTKLTLFLRQTQYPLPNPHPHFTRPNLTSQKRSTLKHFGSNPDLVIKPIGKGSGICLMEPLSKTEEHLVNISTYKELNSDSTQATRNDVLSTLVYLYNTHQKDDVTRHHLMPPKSTSTPFFYGLSNVAKPNIPLRAIVSACDSPTNHLSN